MITVCWIELLNHNFPRYSVSILNVQYMGLVEWTLHFHVHNHDPNSSECCSHGTDGLKVPSEALGKFDNQANVDPDNIIDWNISENSLENYLQIPGNLIYIPRTANQFCLITYLVYNREYTWACKWFYWHFEYFSSAKINCKILV